ncbi:MAG: M48 family metallopeptidase [Candidatus Omnitrophota bacterium]
MNIYEQARRNKTWTWALVYLFIFIFLFLGLGLDYFYGIGAEFPVFTVIALLLGITYAYAGYRLGDKFIIYSTHARSLDLNNPKQKQWQNVVEEMSIASGIPLPKTYIIDDPDPNAFATGRAPEHSSLVVTRGLIDVLNRDEMQGVAGHEISHIKNLDIRLMLIIAILLGSVVLLADWAARGFFMRSRRGDRRNQGSLGLIVLAIWLVTAILAPLLSQVMAMFVSRKREYLADASSAELTRNPLGLAAALEKIEARTGPTRSIIRGTAHMCISDPRGYPVNQRQGRLADLLATHPPVEKRIEALRQMAYA